MTSAALKEFQFELSSSKNKDQKRKEEMFRL